MEVDFFEDLSEDLFEDLLRRVTVVWRGTEGSEEVTVGDGGEERRARLVGEGLDDIGGRLREGEGDGDGWRGARQWVGTGIVGCRVGVRE